MLGEGQVEQHSSFLLKIALFSVFFFFFSFRFYLQQRFQIWLSELLAELLIHEMFLIGPCELFKLIGALNGFTYSRERVHII